VGRFWDPTPESVAAICPAYRLHPALPAVYTGDNSPGDPDEVTTMTFPRNATRFGALQVAICVLAAATALVHIYLGAITHVMVATQPEATAAAGGAATLGFFAALFYLDGLGYIVLTAALYHPAFARFRRLTRWALIALTAATIVAYFALIQGQYDAMGVADKIVEVALIILLVIEGRRDRQLSKVPGT
jgi:hypothetical protein